MAQCKFFVIRKKRFCRMTVKTGKEYCGEHENTNTTDVIDSNKRIKCPLDSKHTCYANKLAKHLKICNAKQCDLPEYIVKNINSGTSLDNDDKFAVETSERLLSNVPVNDIKIVLKKIKQLYNDEIKNKIKENILQSDVLNDQLTNCEYGVKTKKHLSQTSSLLANLQCAGLLKQNCVFIEFGAGKGQLSYWLAKATENIANTSVILIDRASHRHKMDNKLKLMDDNQQERIHRIRADINDLDLSKVDVVKRCGNVVGVTKHLCGVATDFALRCLTNLNHSLNNVSGLLMAFCCHHRCLWKHYFGQQFLLDNNLSSYDFDIICGIVSWATSGVGMSREKREEIDKQSAATNNEIISDDIKRNLELGLTRNEKTEYGQMAKLLLDYGRMKHLETLQFNCQLFYYVSTDVSLENLCILATKT